MAEAKNKLVLSRTFAAPVERVYEAWTKPELMTRWFCPGNLTVPRAESDPQVGGHYRVEMREPDGNMHINTGTYREVQPNERLVFTWHWEGSDYETLVTLDFKAVAPDQTELTLIHDGFPSEEAERSHEGGWVGCLANLEAFLH